MAIALKFFLNLKNNLILKLLHIFQLEIKDIEQTKKRDPSSWRRFIKLDIAYIKARNYSITSLEFSEYVLHFSKQSTIS